MQTLLGKYPTSMLLDFLFRFLGSCITSETLQRDLKRSAASSESLRNYWQSKITDVGLSCWHRHTVDIKPQLEDEKAFVALPLEEKCQKLDQQFNVALTTWTGNFYACRKAELVLRNLLRNALGSERDDVDWLSSQTAQEALTPEVLSHFQKVGAESVAKNRILNTGGTNCPHHSRQRTGTSLSVTAEGVNRRSRNFSADLVRCTARWSRRSMEI